MTKETKIGLIVGLGFIILFAIILSEKGATNNTRAPSALTLADSAGDQQMVTGTSGEPLSGAGRLAIRTPVDRPTDAGDSSSAGHVMAEEPVGQPIPDHGERIHALPDYLVERLNLPMEETEIALDAGADDETDLSPMTDIVDVLKGRGPSDGSDLDPASSQDEDDHMSIASHLDDPDFQQTADVRTTPQKAMRILALHQVKSKESLSKIAARYYGRATPARIEAIFNANRDKLKSIDSVRADCELQIPQLDDTESIAFESVEDFAPAAVVSGQREPRDEEIRIPIPAGQRDATPSKDERGTRRTVNQAEPRSPDFTWYQVREKDTLSRIAKRELGNEKRFGEIFQLNQDIIRNKNLIKPGLKIRLPMESGSSANSGNLAVFASQGNLP